MFMQLTQRTIYEAPTRKKNQRPRVAKLPKTLSPAPQKIVKEVEEEERKEAVKHEEKFEELVIVSQHVLYKCVSFFPFDLFPDEISIEPAQVNIKQKIFFWTSRMVSIPIGNISDVAISTIPFFASLTIVDRFFHQNTVTVSFLKKNEAQRARKIIQGLILANKEGVDITKVKVEELIKRAERIGKMQAIKED